MTIPNILSCSRYFLAVPMYFLVIREAWLWASIILWISIATDVADGYIARHRNQTSSLGGLLDHSADAIFVAILLFALASLGWVSQLLPWLVLAAFLQYLLDSSALSGKPLRTSSLGRYNGISYFVLGGFVLMQNASTFYLLEDHLLIWISWGLVLSTLLSMIDRLVAFIRMSRLSD